MNSARGLLVSLLVLALVLAPCSPAEAGWWKSVKGFCSTIGSAAKSALDEVGKGIVSVGKFVGTAVVNTALLPINIIRDKNAWVSFENTKTGQRRVTHKISPEVAAKLETSHLISTSFDIAGKSFGDGKTFHIKVDQPGEVSCRIDWTGAPALAMILNGPGQVGYYDRIDGSSPLYFKFDVTPALVKKGSQWTISIKDFSKSNRPSKVRLMAFTPRRMGETLSTATVTQRAGFAEQDIRKLTERVADLETQLRLEKQFTRRLMDQIKQLRSRINAVDHKDDGKAKG